MTESEPSSETDKCRLVVDVAMETAAEKCGSEEAARRQVMDLFGFTDDDPEPDCEAVLADGVTEDDLADSDDERRYAMCRAWNLVNTEDVSFRRAVNEGWQEVREAKQGGA